MARVKNKLNRAVSKVIERLEERRLLTTITGGGFDPVTGDPIINDYRYLDAAGHVAVISVGGDTTAVALFAGVNGFNVALGDLVPPPPPGGQNQVTGKDLFNIYVTQSDTNSFISVYEITPATGAVIPFNGSPGTVRVGNATTGRLFDATLDGGIGQLYLGARSATPQGGGNNNIDVNVPIVSARNPGVAGRPSGRVVAGLQVAPGLDFGRFLFGGAVTGYVSIPGSIESFYAGALLTGDASGLPLGVNGTGGATRAPNFVVGGNINSLLVGGSIGTENDTGLDQPDYSTGFDMQVGGVLGQIVSRDSILGGVDVIHGRAKSAFGANVKEVEGRSGDSSAAAPAIGWTEGLLEGSNLVFNNTFNTPQVLPSFPGSKKGRSTVVVNGTLVATPRLADYVDYYAMPMLAGQQLTVTLRPSGTVAATNLMNVGVFDPDGRLVATDYANVDATAVTGAPIHFTADRPGLYRIVVATTGDGDFTGTGGEFGATNIGLSPYVLTINGGGDLALGGVVATNNIYDGQLDGYGFAVENGDFGGMEAGGSIFSGTAQTINVRKGSLRSLEAGQLGLLTNGQISGGPNLFITRGDVGLVRSTSGVLDLNSGAQFAIGGSYQVVSAATTLTADLLANRSIGVIRAAQIGTNNIAPIFTANADLKSDDGIIDLIDVSGNLGTLNAGGPAITTGPGGDVRYIHVGGNVFRDAFFGGGTQEATTYQPGEKVTLNDDSGATVDLEPFPLVPNPAFTVGGTNPAQIGPSLSVIGYGIRGSGGVAIVNVTSDGSIRVGGGGGRGSASHVEIGDIVTTGAGNRVVNSATNSAGLVFSQPTTGTAAVNLDVLIDGSGTVDVYKVEGSDFTSIINRTAGEILNVDSTTSNLLGTIGSLQATNIGVGINHTGAAVNGIATMSNVYPFNQQHNGVVSNSILNVQAGGAIGNLNVTGSIGNLVANAGGRHTTGTFEGIAGPIVASQQLVAVDIGDGILPSGNGNVSKAGLYANTIGTVVNRGEGSDIRGDIVATRSIATIRLSDGAMIGNKVAVFGTYAQSRRFVGGVVLPDSGGDTTTNPIFEIGQISVSGDGGIIGADIAGADVGTISVKGGFGIINSAISDSGDGTIQSVTAEGYGIRGLTIDGGALLNSLQATAKGKSLSTNNYTRSVFQSQRYSIDPYFDQAPSRETDLDVYLGTSARKTKLKRITDAGVIADTTATANRNAGTIFASQIRSSQFSIANSISNIETRGAVDGLVLTTGRLKSYYSGADSFALNFSVAGVIDSFHVNGDLDNTSTIKALGPSGKITNFVIDGGLDGDVSSSNSFHFLAVGKDIGATSLITAKSLDKKQVRGGIFGTIQIG